MKLSFCTLGCPGWTLPQAISNAAHMGYDGIEVRGIAGEHIGAEEPAASRTAIRQAFAQAKVSPAAIMGYSRFTSDEPEKRQAAIDEAIKFLEVARDIGCPTLRVFGGQWGGIAREEAVRRVVDSVRQIAPHARMAGVRLALETHDDWCKGENIRAVIDGVASPSLGICWDVSNAWWVEPLGQTYPLIRDHIIHVHFKDSARSADGHVHSVLPGTGQIDLLRALELLHGGGYRGWLSFEWEKKWEPALAEPEVALPHFYRVTTELMKKAGVPRG